MPEVRRILGGMGREREVKEILLRILIESSIEDFDREKTREVPLLFSPLFPSSFRLRGMADLC